MAEQAAVESSAIIRYPRGDHPTARTILEKSAAKAGIIFVRRVFFSRWL
jgi:hypothetical protein